MNKFLAERGVAARRKCDTLIFDGMVRIDGEVVREPGRRVDPETQRVSVRGRKISEPSDHVYYMFHKPTGVLSTMQDTRGRPTVERYLPKKGPRLFPVGRLDGDTSGLLLFTNDGDLAHRLMHPRFEVAKTYEVTLTLPPTEKALEKLAGGVEFVRGEVSRPATVHVVRSMGEVTVISLTLGEGRNRQVRRMCESLGLEILALKRVSIGPIDLGDLAQGRLRRLRRGEVTALKQLVEDSSVQKRAASRRG